MKSNTHGDEFRCNDCGEPVESRRLRAGAVLCRACRAIRAERVPGLTELGRNAGPNPGVSEVGLDGRGNLTANGRRLTDAEVYDENDATVWVVNGQRGGAPMMTLARNGDGQRPSQAKVTAKVRNVYGRMVKSVYTEALRLHLAGWDDTSIAVKLKLKGPNAALRTREYAVSLLRGQAR